MRALFPIIFSGTQQSPAGKCTTPDINPSDGGIPISVVITVDAGDVIFIRESKKNFSYPAHDGNNPISPTVRLDNSVSSIHIINGPVIYLTAIAYNPSKVDSDMESALYSTL